MKRMLTALTLLAVTAAGPLVDAALHHPRVIDSVRPLAAEVQARDPLFGLPIEGQWEVKKICSSSSINQAKHLWLTAGHCVWNDEDITKIDGHPRFIVDGDIAYEAKVIAFSSEFDLAVLQTGPELSVPALKMSGKATEWGQKVQIPGFPFDWLQPALFFGYVANPHIEFPDGDKPYLLFNMAAAPGNSGSAVLNERGEVVSVLQIGWGRGFSPVSGGATFEQMIQVVWPYFQH